jgi:anti-anti-sigma factor
MSKRQLTISVDKIDGISVVSLTGAIDASNVRDLSDILEKTCSGSPPRAILDCSTLQYVNSTSFGMFFKYHQHCLKQGGALVLAGVQGKIRNIIKILGLEKFLKLYASRKEALAALKRAKAD